MTTISARPLTIDAYTKKYPGVPAEAILKEDLLRLGMTFTDAAMEAAKGCRTQAYYLFSYNISAHGDMKKGVSTAAPEDIVFRGGPHGLKRTSVRVVLNAASPYVVDMVGGVPHITEHGVPIAEAVYPSKPAYYGTTFADGMRYEQVVPLLYDSYAFITTFRACHYWGDKEECRFCDINYNLRELRKLTGDHVTADAIKDLPKVVDVLEAMSREPDPAKRMITIIMTGGSIVRPVRGGPDNATDFNLPYVEAIRERIGRRVPIVMITESQPMENVRRFRDAGVTSHNANLEVWDKRLFQWMAPGKEKYIGYDLWVKRLVDAVAVMGEGGVSPNMVSGVEMAQPVGFSTVKEAVASAREGFEFLMSNGVIPHLDTWCVEPGTTLAGHPPIPLDFLIQADLAWYETWRKYKLPPFAGYGPMGAGPGIAIYGNTASVDLGG
ncbi:MAG: hypothetical protein FJ206_16280 [Gemmatimonadetes bacterium]|nr:hypothetical protein [Gemmatimonadota bacterium]